MMNTERSYVLKPLVLGLIMIVTGSINTIAAKWADNMKVDGKYFNHPFVQAICMFIGELFCLFAYVISNCIRNHRDQMASVNNGERSGSGISTHISEQNFLKFNPWLFVAPALCDVLATSIMYIGLNLTQASSFQMLRGAVIIFTGLFSVAFLRSYLQGFRWLGMGFVTVGLVIVGVSDIIFDKNSKHDINGIITGFKTNVAHETMIGIFCLLNLEHFLPHSGDLLIIIAQIIVAIQMVIEQKIITEFNVPPLLVVGLEGFFGLTILLFLLFPMYFIKVPSIFSTNPYHRLEDVFDAFREVKDNPWIGVALMLTVISIAFFNFAGVSVTKELSATTRMVLDSVRILLIWLVSIPLFGEHFIPLQVLPLITNNQLASCCMSFCGIYLVTMDHTVLVEDGSE
uniref:EamA domain-containing protein n=1 Tax=Setaria digitata TaxID=48799 RepID=A0A915PT77_9BILA